MNIYMDEAGAFIPPGSKRSHLYSLVLALIVPTATEADLFYQFLRLRDSWPQQKVEIKGSKLAEAQTTEVMRLLADHEAIAEYYAIDMALHPGHVIEDIKERQAAALVANLTPEHHPNVVQRLHTHSAAVRAMANPLFVQAFITIELILEIIETAINYFAQRRPEELARFAWTIDRKARTITQMEQLWTTLVLPVGETRSARRPYARVEGFDYSHFSKYELSEATADKVKRHLEWMRKTLPHASLPPDHVEGINARLLLSEERSFADSRSSLGLQLADIVASTLCRALNGHLQRSGWEGAAKLLIRKKVAPFIHLGLAAQDDQPLEPHAAKVWKTLDARSRGMIVEPGNRDARY
jgi:Protein of unknown function (DUF3800)